MNAQDAQAQQLVDQLLDSWDETEFTLEGVRFEIRKLLPLKAFRLLETIRPGINDAVNAIKPEAFVTARMAVPALNRPGMQMAVGLVRVLLALPPETVRKAMDAFFAEVHWTDDKRTVPVSLAGREDEAIKNPFHFYLILARCFVVNFLDYFGGMQSTMAAAVTTAQPDMQT